MKISDFGLSKITQHNQTANHSVCGTPKYFPLETLENNYYS